MTFPSLSVNLFASVFYARGGHCMTVAQAGLACSRAPVGVTMNGSQNLNNSELAGRVGEAWKLCEDQQPARTAGSLIACEEAQRRK